MIQGIHRRSGGGGAEAGEGRRAQHLLAGFGPSVREIPQVSLGDGGRQREGGVGKDPGKATSHSVLAAAALLIFFFSLASSVSPSPLICLFPSQDYDAVGAEEHKNSSQVLVPQELPVTNFQGTRT